MYDPEDGTLTVPTASNWWNTSWSQRKQLTFDNTASTQNLTDFPVLVKLDTGFLAPVFLEEILIKQ